MIVDVIVSFFLLLLLFSLAFYKSCPKRENSFSFDKDFTNVLKAACAIVVILVHVPGFYGNPLQKAVGCFGFVAVSLFFLISAYGMQFSIKKKVQGI